jgi:hypothetical protein
MATDRIIAYFVYFCCLIKWKTARKSDPPSRAHFKTTNRWISIRSKPYFLIDIVPICENDQILIPKEMHTTRSVKWLWLGWSDESDANECWDQKEQLGFLPLAFWKCGPVSNKGLSIHGSMLMHTYLRSAHCQGRRSHQMDEEARCKRVLGSEGTIGVPSISFLEMWSSFWQGAFNPWQYANAYIRF